MCSYMEDVKRDTGQLIKRHALHFEDKASCYEGARGGGS